MKNVRIFYTKTDRMRFVSHLDMTRFMTRMLRKAHLPLWYTEGFHPHAYINFALPLPLGFESSYEVLDIRLPDDYAIDTVCDRLNAVFPPYVRALRADEAVLKTGKVAFAKFEITFRDGGALAEPLNEFVGRPQIIVTKRTKRDEKQINLAEKLIAATLSKNEDGNTLLSLTLPAGSVDNINPELLLNAFFEQADAYYPYRVLRTAILDEEKKLFV
ncbi:MAG: TIGR03936 family radical SAM-associated protein [Clostridia bacterium]|nr:TIGR03936 family radical SAM-associated protein [Clostridia bacterium]